MAENYRDNPVLNDSVQRGSAMFKRWFRAASASVDYFDISEDSLRYDQFEHEAEQYFALYWQQFEVAVANDEPRNKLARASLRVADQRVRDAFMCDTMPHELLEE